MNKNYEDIEDEGLNRVSGKIKFKEKRSKQFFKLFLKGMAFFTVAAVSGGIAGSYISSKKNSTVIYPGSPIIKLDNSGDPTTDYSIVSRNEVLKVMEKISPAIVGVRFISNKVEGQNQVERIGNGIIFKPEGYIIASYRTIKDSGKITVSLPNNDTQVSAKVVGFDKATDIAVIKIDAKNLPFAKFADTTKVNIGDIVVAVGNSMSKEQFQGITTTGIISAKNRNIEIKDSETGKVSSCNIFLTDAVINSGNAGGALCNLSGEIIGINSIKLGKYEDNIEGLGFALSSGNITKTINSIMNFGIVSRAQIGVKAVTAVLEDKAIKGAYVQEVVPGTGSDISGIKPTDIIVEIDNLKITKIEELSDAITNHKVGDKVHIKVWRNKIIVEVDIVLSEQSENNF